MRDSDYQELLKLLIDVGEANKGVVAGNDDRVLDAEGLAIKFVFHAASALYLYRSSTSIPELGASFFDPGSVNVVCRPLSRPSWSSTMSSLNRSQTKTEIAATWHGFWPGTLRGRGFQFRQLRGKQF